MYVFFVFYDTMMQNDCFIGYIATIMDKNQPHTYGYTFTTDLRLVSPSFISMDETGRNVRDVSK